MMQTIVSKIKPIVMVVFLTCCFTTTLTLIKPVIVHAVDIPDWMDEDDAEEQVGQKGWRIVKLCGVFALVCGAIGFFVGLALITNVTGHAQQGALGIKVSLVVIAIAGIGVSIISYFAKV